jgi:hypothetical protein
MPAPSIELQGAIHDALKGDAALMAMINGVYDRVPEDPWGTIRGYITFGPEFTVYEDDDCIRIEEINLQLDVWSRQVGRVHCKQIVDRVRQVLLALPEFTDHALVLAEAPLSRVSPDPDGLTMHGIINLRFVVEVVE